VELAVGATQVQVKVQAPADALTPAGAQGAAGAMAKAATAKASAVARATPAGATARGSAKVTLVGATATANAPTSPATGRCHLGLTTPSAMKANPTLKIVCHHRTDC